MANALNDGHLKLWNNVDGGFVGLTLAHRGAILIKRGRTANARAITLLHEWGHVRDLQGWNGSSTMTPMGTVAPCHHYLLHLQSVLNYCSLISKIGDPSVFPPVTWTSADAVAFSKEVRKVRRDLIKCDQGNWPTDSSGDPVQPEGYEFFQAPCTAPAPE